MSELEVAGYQEEAREAAQRGDWDRVDRVVARAKIVARDNVWMKQSLEALEKYSRKRQTQQFSKEALYSADKMNKRLVADDDHQLSIVKVSKRKRLPIYVAKWNVENACK